jgi:arsenate reductase
MNFLKAIPVVVMLLAGVTFGGPEPVPVLMVCEHGSVKSLMAASLFNQAAAERGLPFRAISRGVNPDESVPAQVAAALTKEGFDIKDFVPARFTATEVESAARIIVIGVDPAALSPDAKVSIDSWNDVPAASVDYNAARASLKQHVDALLAELQKQRDH